MGNSSKLGVLEFLSTVDLSQEHGPLILENLGGYQFGDLEFFSCKVLSLAPLIQVDIGGHPPFPNGSKQFSGHFGNLLFLAGFHFRGHFEGLNEVFSR
jgi:hypothetical protein